MTDEETAEVIAQGYERGYRDFDPQRKDQGPCLPPSIFEPGSKERQYWVTGWRVGTLLALRHEQAFREGLDLLLGGVDRSSPDMP